MDKLIERLVGSQRSANLIKFKSILNGNGNLFELQYDPMDRRFYQSQMDAHKAFLKANEVTTQQQPGESR